MKPDPHPAAKAAAFLGMVALSWLAVAAIVAGLWAAVTAATTLLN